MSLTERERLVLLGTAATGALLAGCSSGGGDGTGNEPVDYGPANTITAVSLTITAADGDSVSIGGTPGTSATVALDGGAAPVDPGFAGDPADIRFAVDVDDGMATESHDVLVAVNASPAVVLGSFPTAHRQEVQHLLQRTGFGASLADLDRYRDTPYDEIVDGIVDGIDGTPTQAEPDWTDDYQYSWRERRDLSQEEKDALGDRINERKRALREWWFREMVVSRSPLTERLVLFWHNVWTSSIDAVPYPQIMYRQNRLMRQYATRFDELAHRIPEDPAMVMYLDSDSNVKGRPNENFARELLELFSLGEGQDYDEADIPEIARCFTGYGLNDNFFFEFKADKHDDGEKLVFGQTGFFHGSDVIDMILAKNRASVYICENLWDEFIGSARDTTQIDSWASLLRSSGYDLKPVLRALFKSDAFRDPAVRGQRVKGPVEMVVAIHRTLGVEPDDYGDWIWNFNSMGQDLMDPPNVRGWPHGTAWIDANTLLNRRDKLRRIADRLRRVVGESVLDGLPDLLLAVPMVGTIDDSNFRNHLRSVLGDAAMNLG